MGGAPLVNTIHMTEVTELGAGTLRRGPLLNRKEKRSGSQPTLGGKIPRQSHWVPVEKRRKMGTIRGGKKFLRGKGKLPHGEEENTQPKNPQRQIKQKEPDGEKKDTFTYAWRTKIGAWG